VEDAVGIDRDNYFGGGMFESITDGACFAAVELVAAGANGNVGEIALRFQDPLITVVDEQSSWAITSNCRWGNCFC